MNDSDNNDCSYTPTPEPDYIEAALITILQVDTIDNNNNNINDDNNGCSYIWTCQLAIF